MVRVFSKAHPTFVCLLLLTSLAMAQTSTSEISGTVRDSSGAVVPNASVTLTNEATGVTYKQSTTNAGLYNFPALPVGSYTVTVEATGFKTTKLTKNTLVVNTPLSVDVTLEIGQITEIVSVEAEVATLQTTNATIGNVVTSKAATELPLNGRNPLTLITLEPGVVQRSQGGAGSGLHVNGSRDRAYNVTIDGIEANESSVPNPTANLYRLTPDNIQEYKVTTSNQTPEEGRNSGASISVATRSGSNGFHGTAFWFLRNTALNANEFFANAQGTRKPDIKMNQFGGELGGPIQRNKTFFFFSYADQKINTTQPIDQTFGAPRLYTASALSGIFRYFVADPRNPFVLNGATITRNSTSLVDPNTGELRPGVRNCTSAADVNCIASYNFAANDPNRIGVDPAIAKLFASYPKPNNYQVGDGLNIASYSWNPPTNFRGPNFIARGDHQINISNSVFFRALWGDYNTLKGDPLNSRPQVFPGFPPLGEVYRTTRNFAFSYRSVLSSNVINEMTLGVSRFIFLFTQGEANPAFPNVPPYTFNFTPSITLPYINTPRTFRAVTTPQIIDNITFVRGSHAIRAGANIRMYRHNDQRGQPGGINVTPTLTFSATVRPPSDFATPALASSTVSGLNSTDNTTLLGTINDVMGIPARLSQNFLGDISHNGFLPFLSGNKVTLWNEGHRLKQYNFFLQDEWKLRNNFTVTYGARWEINLAPTESGGRVYVPDGPIVGNSGLVSFKKSDRWFQNNNLGAIGPRVGLAWSPRGNTKTVIRSGWGIAFDPISSFQVTAVAGKVPGLVFSCSSVAGGATTPGCSPVPDVRINQGFPNALPAPTTQPAAQLTPPIQLQSNAPTLTVFDQNLKLQTVHQWDLTIQRELPGGLVTEIGYIGKRGIRLLRAYDINQINADGILPSFRIMQANVANGCAPDGTGCAGGQAVPIVQSGAVTAAFVNSATTRTDISQNGAGNFAGRIEQNFLGLKLRPNQQFAGITYIDSGGDSYYHGMQVTVRKRFEAGLLFGVAYTLSKSIDDQSVDPVGASSGGGLSTTNSRTPADTRNWRLERGLSDVDRRHVLTAQSVYEFPFGKGKPIGANVNRVLNHLIGGWNINGLFTRMTGEPFSVRSGVFTSNFSHQSRADLIGPMPSTELQAGPGVGPYVLSPSLVTDPTNRSTPGFKVPLPGEDGAGRNIFKGPGYWNVDLGVTKYFQLTEDLKMQFRAEGFNAFNHANFDHPVSASVGSPSILSTVFGQSCCATVAPPSTQTVIQTGESGRIIQFALKLMF
ncbi:MAG: TonB-dependent receptor [Acidobacteria bacterium]|nr:MAG: TonB-dependent receptor [Acidobacteriota bacterium]